MSRRKIAFAALLVTALVGIVTLAFSFGDPGSGSSGKSSSVVGLAAVVVAVLAVYLGRKSDDGDRNG